VTEAQKKERLGTEIRLLGGNFKAFLSALGHKRTLRLVRLMSALPPKADIVQTFRGAFPSALTLVFTNLQTL
jgi:hypothetical protein